MARRKEGTFDAIASMPWPVGFVFGIVAHIGVRYGGSRILSTSDNPFLSALGKELDKGTIQILAWLLLGVCWFAALCSFLVRRNRSRLLGTQTGPESLRAMDWRHFEMLVGEAFRRQGYRIEETGLGGADGGIDLFLSRDGGTTLVQCKQWRGQRVDVRVVREMYGLLAHHGADAVKIVTVGDFTPDAQRFAQGKPIELIHGDALVAMIRDAQASPARKTAPVVKPTQAIAIPNCPNCGALMVKRTNRRSGDAFWGCPQYPSCRGTRAA
jgi:restriction system protein